MLVHLKQLRVSVLAPVDVLPVLLVDLDSETDPAFDVAQFNETMLSIIQVDAVIVRDAISFIQSIFDVEEFGDREGGSDQGSVGLIDLVGQRRSGGSVVRSLRQAMMRGQGESDGR